MGSSRIITDSSGNVCYDADFYPFGGEREVTDTCPQNYKFTGKERDDLGNGTTLDNFGARYYSSQMARHDARLVQEPPRGSVCRLH